MSPQTVVRWLFSVALLCGDVTGPSATELQTAQAGDATARLITDLDATDANVRFRAVVRLGLLKDPAAIEPLARRFQDPRYQIRELIGWALGLMKDQRATPVLLTALGNPMASSYAASALGEIGDPKAVEPLIAALRATQEETRGEAAEALGKLRDPRALKPLIELIRDKGIYTRRRFEANTTKKEPSISSSLEGKRIAGTVQQALVHIGGTEAVSLLKTALEAEADADTRKAIEETLKKLQAGP